MRYVGLTQTNVSKLSFSPLVREGASNVGQFRASKTERYHLDFLVDGTSLYDLTNAYNFDLISTLGWSPPEQEARVVRMLLLDIPGDLWEGRQSLFVCGECGDIGCGAITANVSRIGDAYVWKDFAYENNYDEAMTDREGFAHVGPFTFDSVQYREALTNVLFARK